MTRASGNFAAALKLHVSLMDLTVLCFVLSERVAWTLSNLNNMKPYYVPYSAIAISREADQQLGPRYPLPEIAVQEETKTLDIDTTNSVHRVASSGVAVQLLH